MVLERWHNFVKTKDASILDSLISEDAVFYSPVVHTPQRGDKITKTYLKVGRGVLYPGSFIYLLYLIPNK